MEKNVLKVTLSLQTPNSNTIELGKKTDDLELGFTFYCDRFHFNRVMCYPEESYMFSKHRKRIKTERM